MGLWRRTCGTCRPVAYLAVVCGAGFILLYLTLPGDTKLPSRQGIARMRSDSYIEALDHLQHGRARVHNRRIQAAPGRPSKYTSPYDQERQMDDRIVEKAAGLSGSVVLLTYMRSGSSMTADILQRHKDVFYVFEPLHAIEKDMMYKRSIFFLNGTERAHGTYNLTEVYLTDLVGWLTCNFNKITLQSLFSRFMRLGRKTESTMKCLDSNITYKVLCVEKLAKTCRSSKTKLVKTLRISMNVARDVLKEIPGSKVIHLVRDPRATLNSKMRLDNDCRHNVTSELCVKSHCDSVTDNARTLRSFSPALRERAISVRYEDIIEDPIRNSKRLYDFVGLDFSDEIADYVFNITVGGNISQCKVCGLRWQANRKPNISSAEHATHWKEGLTLTQVKVIQDSCKKVLSYYGYKAYNLND